MADIFTNQTIDLFLETSVDCTAVTLKKILYKKPDNVTGFWTPTVVSTTQLFRQISTSEIGAEPGVWEVQAYIEEGALHRYGEIFKFVINSPIS